MELARLERLLDDEDEVFYSATKDLLEGRRLSALEERHSFLVDKRFASGLTLEEEHELKATEHMLDIGEAEFYEPIKRRLRLVLQRYTR